MEVFAVVIGLAMAFFPSHAGVAITAATWGAVHVVGGFALAATWGRLDGTEPVGTATRSRRRFLSS